MMGLLADGWFYISSVGLLISGILFFFLLGQYRVASEAADVTEGEKGADKEVSVPTTIRPVYIPDEPPAAQIASHADKIEAKVEPEAKPMTEVSAPDRRKESLNTTGGISPAVVYLQNIKIELADLHKDLRTLAQRVDTELASVSSRDEALIERLGELTRAVESMKAAAPAETAPAPKKARKTEKAAEPVLESVLVPEPEPAPALEVFALDPAPAAEPEPVPEPVVAPAPAADETIRMDLSALIAAPPSLSEPEAIVEQAPAVQAEPEPALEEKPRRGPVWPV